MDLLTDSGDLSSNLGVRGPLRLRGHGLRSVFLQVLANVTVDFGSLWCVKKAASQHVSPHENGSVLIGIEISCAQAHQSWTVVTR